MKCKICNKLIAKGKKHCPTCAKAVQWVKKIPKAKRSQLKRLVTAKKVSVRRLLSA